MFLVTISLILIQNVTVVTIEFTSIAYGKFEVSICQETRLFVYDTQ